MTDKQLLSRIYGDLVELDRRYYASADVFLAVDSVEEGFELMAVAVMIDRIMGNLPSETDSR